MYTIQNAARALGVSPSTVRSWIAKDKLETTIIETDRKRIYLSYNDILTLADKHKPPIIDVTDQKKNHPDTTGLYPVSDAARILGVQHKTLHNWIVQHNIERKLITTDRKRAYLSYNDMVALAEMHNRTIAYDNAMTEHENSAQEDCNYHEDKLYTVADASLFLGVSEYTVRQWLSAYNIEKKTVDTDKGSIYIAYSDIIMLASKRNRESRYPINISTNIREIRYRLEKLEEGILNLEKYIKRSIYLGK